MNVAATLLDEQNEAAVQAPRILVVEDERIVARSLRSQLMALGYEVVDSVSSGEEAIVKSEELLPDLVLMDINLEGPMDGVEAAAIICQRFQLPVVYLTAYSNMEILERAKVTEPFGYILKPYEDRELHVVIETALYKHRMERRQHDREQWFVATLKSIGDAVIANDNEGRITYMNPLAERLTGWASREALGQTMTEVVQLVHEDSRRPVESSLEKATQDGAQATGVLLIAKDGSEKAVEDCVSVIKGEQGETVGRVVVFRDVTWRKHLEEQFRQAKKLEAIARLAGGVAHAFNNLMTTVLGHSEIMLSGMKPGDPFFASAQEIKRSATRTAALTQKLLAFGRKRNFTLCAVNVNAVVIGLAQVIQHMQGGVRLDLSLDPGLGPTRADQVLLEEVILILCRNACEAMPNGGRVTIQTANVELGQDYADDHPEVQSGPYILLAVSDTGVGMGQETLSHLFEPFYTKEAGVGAGLGLATVYGIVKQCGGDIDVRSQPEKGTTFRLYFPRESSA
jgi:PAS domain S-box-containing protein